METNSLRIFHGITINEIHGGCLYQLVYTDLQRQMSLRPTLPPGSLVETNSLRIFHGITINEIHGGCLYGLTAPNNVAETAI